MLSEILDQLLFISLVLLALLLLWRVWAFIIRPALHPREPKELPYWLPYFGHAVGFFRDSHGTLTYARKYFGNSREPFAITVAGSKLYIITSAQDAASVYKNTTELTFDDYIQDTMFTFGASLSAVEKMWRVPGVSSPVAINPNPMRMTLAHLCEDFYRQQLHPGEKFEVLQTIFLHKIDQSLVWKNISDEIVLSASARTKNVSLLGWCRTVLLDAATRSFFGDRLLQIKPDLFQKFFDFDDNSWQLTYKLPGFLCKEMYAAKKASVDTLTQYFQLAREERPGAAWLVRNLETEMKNVGIGEPDIATFVMMVYWVINGNAYKLCFWILSYAIHDPKLLNTIRKELSAAFRGKDINLDYLFEHCPYLDAVYNEVLRITASSSSVRTVVTPVDINGKTLSPGRLVLVPSRQLHFNEEVFGIDVLQFRPERFLEDKSLSRNMSFKPFGGGRTLCPGRFLARREVITFIALVLQRFELSLTDFEQTINVKEEDRLQFPKIDERKPCLGIMGPIKGDDIRVYVRMAT